MVNYWVYTTELKEILWKDVEIENPESLTSVVIDGTYYKAYVISIRGNFIKCLLNGYKTQLKKGHRQ